MSLQCMGNQQATCNINNGKGTLLHLTGETTLLGCPFDTSSNIYEN